MDALGSGDPGLALKAGEERNGGEWRSGAIQARGFMDCDTLTMNNIEYVWVYMSNYIWYDIYNI